MLHAPALVDQGGHAAREHGLAHQGERHTEVGSVHAGPLAGAFLAGGVEDVVDKVLLAAGSFALVPAHESHTAHSLAHGSKQESHAKMSAVMSMRKESRSPVLHLQATPSAARKRGAGGNRAHTW